MSEPERRCIGCGLRGPQGSFLRLSLDLDSAPPRVMVVAKGGQRGRGAYLCRRRACLDRALQKKAFQRAFRTTVVVNEGEIGAALLGIIDE
ncbi:MAG: YlxR family protein [Thermoleophilia bacterium]|nr:YlxR family protein [Thermoleophilia bacterium]